ncbi:MAG: type II secretion system protein [Deltaproteobacteria bacterium]|nr:type II secretion system protein [Deltaproteobacteria bacterium]
MKSKFNKRGLSLFTDGAQRSRRIGTVPGNTDGAQWSRRIGTVPGNEGRTTFEALLITSLLGILLVIAISNFLTSVRLTREAAMRIELSNIRTSIILYITLNRRYPESLSVMVREGYTLPTGSGPIKYKYIEGMAVDKDGNLLDTFGAPFSYESKTGWVKSSSKGYESW